MDLSVFPVFQASFEPTKNIGFYSTDLVLHWLKLYPNMKPVIVVLKQYLRNLNFNNSYTGNFIIFKVNNKQRWTQFLLSEYYGLLYCETFCFESFHFTIPDSYSFSKVLRGSLQPKKIRNFCKL